MGLWDAWRRSWSGDYRVHGDVRAAHCVIGFSFGAVRKDGEVVPGPSNEVLADIIVKEFGSLPLLLQSEIADSLPPSLAVLRRIGEHRRGPYLDSRAVARQALEVMREKGWTTAVVLAHRHHVPRAEAVCRRLGIDTVVPEGLARVPFCTKSLQWWTRGPVRWRLREVPAVFWHWCRGWLA